MPIDDERSVHELHYVNVLLLSVPRCVSDRMPNYSRLCSRVQCRDVVWPLRLGSLSSGLGLGTVTQALRR